MKRVPFALLPSHFLRTAALLAPSVVGVLLLRADKSLETPHPVVVFRIDDYPHPDLTLGDFAQFDQVFNTLDTPYLLGVTPWLEARPDQRKGLTRPEVEYLKAAVRESRVELALHGFTHKHGNYRGYDTEIALYSQQELRNHLVLADSWFKEHDLPLPQAFIPPFNTMTAGNFEILAKRFRIVTGGSLSLSSFGKFSPQKMGKVAYFPSYAPLYGRARSILRRIKIIKRMKQPHVITLHWAWERSDGYIDLRELIRTVKREMDVWPASRVVQFLDERIATSVADTDSPIE